MPFKSFNDKEELFDHFADDIVNHFMQNCGARISKRDFDHVRGRLKKVVHEYEKVNE